MQFGIYSNHRYGGTYKISGNVYNKGNPNIPVAREVSLEVSESGLIIAKTWSDPTTGAFSFDYLAYIESGYTIHAEDHNRIYNAVIIDHITPEFMV